MVSGGKDILLVSLEKVNFDVILILIKVLVNFIRYILEFLIEISFYFCWLYYSYLFICYKWKKVII